MTLDERIEALTQSVELLSLMHQDNEKRFAAFAEAANKQIEAASKQIAQLVNISERLINVSERLKPKGFDPLET